MKKILKKYNLLTCLLLLSMFCTLDLAAQSSELIITFLDRGTGSIADGSAGNDAEVFTICYNTCAGQGAPASIDLDGVEIMDNVQVRTTLTATSIGGSTILAENTCLTLMGPWYPDGVTASNTAQFNSGGDCALILNAPASVDLVVGINSGGTADVDCASAIAADSEDGNTSTLGSQLSCPVDGCPDCGADGGSF